MKLGDSLGRRRGRRRSGPSGDSSPPPEREPSRSLLPWLKGRNLAIGVATLALVGWLFGYGVATRVLFPAPPPPGDLYEVPDLRGLGLAIASERLAGVGLDLGGVDSLQHPSVAAGLVLGQSPLPGQLVRPENPVRVTVSTGPQTRAVPDVLGLDEDRARIVLETSGFIVSADTMESVEPRGRVVAVYPAADSVVALPAEVRVTVSTGPPVVPMPFVLGMEREEAEMLLDSLGLVVSDVEEVFRFGRDQGIVVEQEPAAETELQRGSSVRLTVGRGGRGGEEQ
ncbi:MAG: PASTA domain-containing protein [Longimicrobiales bacterium]|nr:PASTA domain-containing protein [Longimicrobiales bacterium]